MEWKLQLKKVDQFKVSASSLSSFRNLKSKNKKVNKHSLSHFLANAYLHFSSFKSYTYDPPLPSEESQAQIDQLADEGEEEDERISAFQINLSTMMECLNIFGNAGSNGSNSFSSSNASSGGRGGGEEGSSNRFRRNERDEELGGTADGKVTSLRMSYSGYGTPLILLYVVLSSLYFFSSLVSLSFH